MAESESIGKNIAGSDRRRRPVTEGVEGQGQRGEAPMQALEEIAANSGKQFDPVVVEAFTRVLDKKLETIIALVPRLQKKCGPCGGNPPPSKLPLFFDLTRLFLI